MRRPVIVEPIVLPPRERPAGAPPTHAVAGGRYRERWCRHKDGPAGTLPPESARRGGTGGTAVRRDPPSTGDAELLDFGGGARSTPRGPADGGIAVELSRNENVGTGDTAVGVGG
ncbi:hypothetical protein GCM10023222_12360 [Saccharopolyspora cebuensis]